MELPSLGDLCGIQLQVNRIINAVFIVTLGVQTMNTVTHTWGGSCTNLISALFIICADLVTVLLLVGITNIISADTPLNIFISILTFRMEIKLVFKGENSSGLLL